MQTKTQILGLVLAGGQSRRMGQDKGLLSYHGKPQREYLYEQLQPLCEQVFMSIRPDQAETLPNNYPTLVDENQYRGPFNGLISAHHAFPEAAWLVVACDLPFMDTHALATLVSGRNPHAVATAFATRASGLPEPLAALWEPSGLQRAIDYLENGSSTCPRKFLIQNEAQLVFPEDDLWVANANSPEEYQEYTQKQERP